MESRNGTPVISRALEFYHKDNILEMSKLEVSSIVESIFAVEAKKKMPNLSSTCSVS